jgi:cytoskeleton protein RodZ
MALEHTSSAAAQQPQLRLEARRRERGISLEQIAETTKISLRFLQAIEAEEFGLLPGGLFNTSYIRQYAAAIGFDSKELLDYYHTRTGAHPQASGKPKRSGFWWFRLANALKLVVSG